MKKVPRITYNLQQSVISVLERNDVLATPAAPVRLVVAVSGGIDSVVLLHILHSLRSKLDLKLFVCHVDHGLRKTSKRDAEFVKKLAAKLKLPFFLYNAPKRAPKTNLEAWAREVRYGFLTECLEENSADFIVTAHHKLDQAETFLFKLLSGRILTESRCIREIDSQRRMLRPFLHADKELIDAAAKEKKLAFVQDETNFSREHTRNLIRNDLIPKLKAEYNDNIVQTLCEIVSRTEDDENFLSAAAKCFNADSTHPIALLSQQPHALLWRSLREIATAQIGEDAGKLGYKAYKIMADAICAGKPHPQKFDLGLGIVGEISKRGGVKFAIRKTSRS